MESGASLQTEPPPPHTDLLFQENRDAKWMSRASTVWNLSLRSGTLQQV